ncbi:hypothetical protein LDENG_00177940 [Lucifuga dentata]|nr:hypothetical protein LDENG_00177940 [Lucifuga dentata]
MGAELQEDEQFYSQMTDEIKEARFAAGVAEQFALAEAAMNVWSMNDALEQPCTSLQAAQSHFLSHFLLDGGSVGVPQHLYSIHTHNDTMTSLLPSPQAITVSPQAAAMSPQAAAISPQATAVSLLSNARQDGEFPVEEGGAVTAEAAVRHVDSSSLSEDDVFYN